MPKHSEQDDSLAGLLGLGTHSARKSHYPELVARLEELEAERNRYVWSRAADAAVGVAANKAGTERTDVMTLLTVNPATGEASALSIPRDMEFFPLKPSLASTFCRPGRKTFNAKVNALFVYAQLCMAKTPALDGWERSSLAASKVKEELAWALDIEIDDWVLVGFGTADIMGAKLDALAVMESQFLAGGALGHAALLPKTPADKPGRVAAVRASQRARYAGIADRFRKELKQWYGEERGAAVKHAEAFEICEYGRRPDREELKQLFPFFS